MLRRANELKAKEFWAARSLNVIERSPQSENANAYLLRELLKLSQGTKQEAEHDLDVTRTLKGDQGMKTRKNYSLAAISIAIVAISILFAPATTVKAFTGPAVLDDWGNRFTSLGASVPENALRTQVRTTIAQMAMFDAVNAVLDGPYRPFATKPLSVPGASPEAAAIRAAFIVALNEFPTKTATIDDAYNTSISGVSASPQAIAAGIGVGDAAANAVLLARVGDHRNDPELEGYTPRGGPGVWIPTPPAFGDPLNPFLQFVTPFGYDDPARFHPKPPPALDSRTYRDDYNETREYGSATST